MGRGRLQRLQPSNKGSNRVVLGAIGCPTVHQSSRRLIVSFREGKGPSMTDHHRVTPSAIPLLPSHFLRVDWLAYADCPTHIIHTRRL